MSEAAKTSRAAAVVEIEQRILGWLLIDAPGMRPMVDAVEAIAPSFAPPHDRIAEKIVSAVRRGIDFGPTAIGLQLADDEGLTEIGGVEYLRNLARAAPAIISEADGATHFSRANKTHAELAVEDIGAEHSSIATIRASSFAPVAPDRVEYVEGLIPAEDVTGLSGDGGAGKTTLALQMVVASQRRTNFLGRIVYKNGPALILSAEDDLDELHRRLARILQSEGGTFGDLNHLHIASLVGMDTIAAEPTSRTTIAPTPFFDAIKAKISQLQPDLTVVDTLSDFFGGDENNRGHARQFISALRGLAKQHKTTILLLSHPSLTGMASGSGLSGTTGWSNSLRTRLYLDHCRSADGAEDDPDLRILRTKKNNYGPAGGEIRVRWSDGSFKLESASGPATLAATTRVDRVFLDLVRTYRAERRDVRATPGHGFAPSIFAADKRSNGVGKRALTDAMNRLLSTACLAVEELGPPSRRTHRLVEPVGQDG